MPLFFCSNATLFTSSLRRFLSTLSARYNADARLHTRFNTELQLCHFFQNESVQCHTAAYDLGSLQCFVIAPRVASCLCCCSSHLFYATATQYESLPNFSYTYLRTPMPVQICSLRRDAFSDHHSATYIYAWADLLNAAPAPLSSSPFQGCSARSNPTPYLFFGSTLFSSVILVMPRHAQPFNSICALLVDADLFSCFSVLFGVFHRNAILYSRLNSWRPPFQRLIMPCYSTALPFSTIPFLCKSAHRSSIAFLGLANPMQAAHCQSDANPHIAKLILSSC